jgi:hypothetical protein
VTKESTICTNKYKPDVLIATEISSLQMFFRAAARSMLNKPEVFTVVQDMKIKITIKIG